MVDAYWDRVKAERRGKQFTLLEKQSKVVIEKRVRAPVEFNAKYLRELHKRVRVGLVKPGELTAKQKRLLEKYYGY